MARGGESLKSGGPPVSAITSLLRLKSIPLTADETLIERARLVAPARGTTLNLAFREWLEQYARSVGLCVDELMRCLRHVLSSGPYTRDQMNDR
jgi:hypothetical protein